MQNGPGCDASTLLRAEQPGALCEGTIDKTPRWHRIEKLSISQIARGLGASRNTVEMYLISDVTRPEYGPRPKRFPAMGPWAAQLLELLTETTGATARCACATCAYATAAQPKKHEHP